MLRSKPKLKYSGITIVLSNPSRYDTVSLLSGPGGHLFNELLRLDYNTMQCDIRLADDTSPFVENTKAIILLGEYAMHKYVPETKGNSLNEMRGSPFYYKDIPTIATYFPQDAADMRAHEQEHNPLSKEYTGDESWESEDEDEGDVKRFSPTRKSNYAFWIKQDLSKVKRLLKQTNNKWEIEKPPEYRIFPHPDEVINTLSKYKGMFLEFDIETDYEEQNLLCFSYTPWNGTHDISTIRSVPIIDYNYTLAYGPATIKIIRALIVAIRDNTLVAHNGAAFDFFVLGAKYHIPVYKTYDTMIAQHRIYPDVEKSLGHCTSLWTMQKFHKDTDSHAYRCRDHMIAKLNYCAKDVFTMWLVHKAQSLYIPTIPGLRESVECGMRSIRPYLICSMQGIRYDEDKVDKLSDENDRLMMQYMRIINILIGPLGLAECKKSVKGKAKGFANSNTQCVDYFHRQLEYQVVARSKKTQKPSLGKKALYKLALSYPDNPVITFVCLFRQVAKEYSALTFYPFKDDNNKIIPYVKEPT